METHVAIKEILCKNCNRKTTIGNCVIFIGLEWNGEKLHINFIREEQI